MSYLYLKIKKTHNQQGWHLGERPQFHTAKFNPIIELILRLKATKGLKNTYITSET